MIITREELIETTNEHYSACAKAALKAIGWTIVMIIAFNKMVDNAHKSAEEGGAGDALTKILYKVPKSSK